MIIFWDFQDFLIYLEKYFWSLLNSPNLTFNYFFAIVIIVWKVSKYRIISGPYFPVFGLNTEIYGVNICIQWEYRKIRTRNNPVFGHFSRSESK